MEAFERQMSLAHQNQSDIKALYEQNIAAFDNHCEDLSKKFLDSLVDEREYYQYFKNYNSLNSEINNTINLTQNIVDELKSIHFDHQKTADYQSEKNKYTKKRIKNQLDTVKDRIYEALRNGDFYQANYILLRLKKEEDKICSNALKNIEDLDYQKFYFIGIALLQIPNQSLFHYLSAAQFLKTITQTEVLSQYKDTFMPILMANLNKILEDQQNADIEVYNVEELATEHLATLMQIKLHFEELGGIQHTEVAKFMRILKEKFKGNFIAKMEKVEKIFGIHNYALDVLKFYIFDSEKLDPNDPIINPENIMNFFNQCISNPENIWASINRETSSEKFIVCIQKLNEIYLLFKKKKGAADQLVVDTCPNVIKCIIKANFDSKISILIGRNTNEIKEVFDSFLQIFKDKICKNYLSQEMVKKKLISRLAKHSFGDSDAEWTFKIELLKELSDKYKYPKIQLYRKIIDINYGKKPAIDSK